VSSSLSSLTVLSSWFIYFDERIGTSLRGWRHDDVSIRPAGHAAVRTIRVLKSNGSHH